MKFKYGGRLLDLDKQFSVINPFLLQCLKMYMHRRSFIYNYLQLMFSVTLKYE